MILDHRILLRVEDGRLVPGAPGPGRRLGHDPYRRVPERVARPALVCHTVLCSCNVHAFETYGLNVGACLPVAAS